MYRKPTLLLAAIVAALGGFLFGFDTAVISGTTQWLQEYFKLSSGTLGFTVASAILGTIAGSNTALLQSVAIGGTFVVFTTLALAVIDKYGRKTLMIVGSLGYIISLSVAAWAFYTYGTNFSDTGSIVVLVSLLVFIASHSFGQGTVIWVFISEMFPNRIRARGQAFGSFTHWFMAAAISWTFPVIAEISGGHTFAFYGVCMVGQLIWVLLVMPETKGLTLENIQKKLGIS